MLFRNFSETASENINESIYKTIEPFKNYVDDNEDVLIFHVVNVGQGLMILIIFPDKTTMLFDCYLTNDTETKLLNYLEGYIPIRKNDNSEDEQWIDIFVNSHRDQDHYKGLKSINNKFKIKSIWDSGCYGTGAKSNNSDYNYYMYLKREIKKTYGDDAVPTMQPSSSVLHTFGLANIYCLNSKEDFAESPMSDTDVIYSLNGVEILEASNFFSNYEIKKQHTNCIVLLIDYNGKRLMLTGDSDWKSWKDYIVPNFKDCNLLKSDILVASHHGSRSFFTDENLNTDIDPENNPDTTCVDQIDYIAPIITVISCGNYDKHHHPNAAAVKIYKEYSANEQVYTTNDKDSSFIGFIKSDGYLGVTTSSFINFKSSIDIDFELTCESTKDGYVQEVFNGQKILVGCKLKFKAQKIKGIADNLIKEDVHITWEISNSGRKEDINHHEIYFMGKDEKKVSYSAEMSRDLVYNGIHLVRCTIENRDRDKKITKVFCIDGIK